MKTQSKPEKYKEHNAPAKKGQSIVTQKSM